MYKEGNGSSGVLTRVSKGKLSCFSIEFRTCLTIRNSFKIERHCSESRNSLSFASSNIGEKFSKELIGKEFPAARNSTISDVTLSALLAESISEWGTSERQSSDVTTEHVNPARAC